MNNKPNKAVLFDLDGTLIDTAPDMIYALKTVLKNNHTNTSISDKTLRKYVSDGSIGLINLVFPNENNAEILRLQSQFLDAYEKNLSSESQIFPHLDDLLFFLENNHFMWGIVTNKPTRMTLQLLNCLELYCPYVVCGDTLRDRKPSPKPLIIASKLMNIDPINITYVGDAKRDIEAGRLANMKTVSAEYGYIKDEDDPKSWDADISASSPIALNKIIKKGLL
jgi:phosphoglycolate phosphatase